MKVRRGSRVLQGTGAGKTPSHPWQHVTRAADPSQPSPAEQGMRELGETPLNQHSSLEVGFLCSVRLMSPSGSIAVWIPGGNSSVSTGGAVSAVGGAIWERRASPCPPQPTAGVARSQLSRHRSAPV